MGRLIRAKSYEQIAKIKLPVVDDPSGLSLDREVNLFRNLIAAGLSKNDNHAVAKALECIGTMLAKSNRLTRVPLMAKSDLIGFAKLLASIAQRETGLCTQVLEGRLTDAAQSEVNRPDEL
jgi:hypothetical protein